MELSAIKQLSALSHSHRLALFRLLVRRYPTDVPAGEISKALELKSNTTSAYLNTLREAGLVSQRRDGTSLFYKADMEQAQDLVQFLFSDCCRDRLAVDLPRSDADIQTDKSLNVLFVCTGNSARSICAEAILRDTNPAGVNAYSAGTDPAGQPKPSALNLLELKGHDIDGLYSKDLSSFRQAASPRMDVVITLCDRAANEECPIWQGHPVASHWSIPDPSRQAQKSSGQDDAFERMYSDLFDRITRLNEINIKHLGRQDLQCAIDRIALPIQEGLIT